MNNGLTHEPKGTNSWDGERNTEGPLNYSLGVRGSSFTMMKDQEEYDEDDLIEELAPTLHEESHCNFATSVKSIFSC